MHKHRRRFITFQPVRWRHLLLFSMVLVTPLTLTLLAIASFQDVHQAPPKFQRVPMFPLPEVFFDEEVLEEDIKELKRFLNEEIPLYPYPTPKNDQRYEVAKAHPEPFIFSSIFFYPSSYVVITPSKRKSVEGTA